MSDSAGDVFTAIAQVLAQRKQADPATSYTAGLFGKGQDAILQKIGEESVEAVLASKTGDPGKIVYETADLWFHTLVMLSYHQISPDEVLAELQRRFGVSGVAEKQARKS